MKTTHIMATWFSQSLTVSVLALNIHRLAAPASSIWNNVGLDTCPLSNFMPPWCAEQTRAN